MTIWLAPANLTSSGKRHFTFTSSSVRCTRLPQHHRVLRPLIRLFLTAAMSNLPSSKSSPEQVFSNYGLHRALQPVVNVDGEVTTQTENESKDQKYRRYIIEREEDLLTELESAKAAFDQVAEERDAIDEDHAADASRSTQISTRYLEANNRLAKAGRAYRVFASDIEELQHIPETWNRDDAQAWSDRKTMEKMQREDEAAEDRVRERYESQLKEAGEFRIMLAEKNLKLRELLYVSWS